MFAAYDLMFMLGYACLQYSALHALQVLPQAMKQLAMAQQTPTQSIA